MSDRKGEDRVKSLKQQAAEAMPQDIVREGLPYDIVTLVEYYKVAIVTCKHDATWTFTRGEINGVVTFTCGCIENWSNGKYTATIEDCNEEFRECCGEWGGVRVWGCVQGVGNRECVVI